jgi:KUP system potassium uptake protein
MEGSNGSPSAVRGVQPQSRRPLHEAAHKLPYLPEEAEPSSARAAERTRQAAERARRFDQEGQDIALAGGRTALVVGALGIVYGDIGTSPLYTEQTVFSSYHATAQITVANVYGAASLIFWALMIVVSIKYAGFIMRAHNRGDGGIMALAALLQRHKLATGGILVTLGIFGAGLFFGDGMITPTISVLGALQGIQVATPSLVHLVVPLSVAVLVALFVLQRFGSGTIGWLFGPVMLLWFTVIAAFGLGRIAGDPAVFQALSPAWAVRFFADHGVGAYLMLGGVVLAVTGAEALYADRGHFGATPIRLGWFGLVLPALALNYLGQAAWIVHHPRAAHASGFNPFFQMLPHWGLWPMVVVATAATIIASQAVISGSFSVARQAVALGFLPRLKILHPSRVEGQIYVPIINWTLCIGVVALTLIFRSSTRLGDIYGVAVTGTFVLNTLLFLAVARLLWRTPKLRLAPLALLFLTVEVAFFSSNITKIDHGAWLPLVVGLAVAVVMVTWRRGQVIVTRNRTQQEGALEEFLAELAACRPPVRRVPGTAVFLSPTPDTTPLALRAQFEHNHALHERVLIVTVEPVSVPQVGQADRSVVRIIGPVGARVTHVAIRFGYRERQEIPAALALARKQGLLDKNLDLEGASYFLSRIWILPGEEPSMARWRKKLFVVMARNAASPAEHFGLPLDRIVMVGAEVIL